MILKLVIWEVEHLGTKVKNIEKFVHNVLERQEGRVGLESKVRTKEVTKHYAKIDCQRTDCQPRLRVWVGVREAAFTIVLSCK